MATDEDNNVVIIEVTQGAEGKSTINYKPVKMATQGWIGARSIKYPAKAMEFVRVEDKHAKALNEWHTSETPVIEINSSHTTRLHTRDGTSRDLLPGDMVEFSDPKAEFRLETVQPGDREVIALQL